jgi:hypothetical protein
MSVECDPGLISSLVVSLSMNTSLKPIGLNLCDLHDDDVIALCKGVVHNQNLQYFGLADCGYGDKGLTAVFN